MGQAESAGQRLDCMAVDAVQRQPVSGGVSANTGKNTGKNRKKRPPSPGVGREVLCFRAFLALFLLLNNREANLQ